MVGFGFINWNTSDMYLCVGDWCVCVYLYECSVGVHLYMSITCLFIICDILVRDLPLATFIVHAVQQELTRHKVVPHHVVPTVVPEEWW